MIEIHSVFGVCIPPDMGLADIENCSIPEDTPGITLNQSFPVTGNADNSPEKDKP